MARFQREKTLMCLQFCILVYELNFFCFFHNNDNEWENADVMLSEGIFSNTDKEFTIHTVFCSEAVLVSFEQIVITLGSSLTTIC